MSSGKFKVRNEMIDEAHGTPVEMFVNNGKMSVHLPDGETHNLLDTRDRVLTNPMEDEGDLIIGGQGGTIKNLKRGTFGQILTSSFDSIIWKDPQQVSGNPTAPFPSGEYLDITVGASGDVYTAINDGWVNIVCTNASTNGWCSIVNVTRAYTTGCNSYSTGRIIYAMFPVSKDDRFELTYYNVNFDIFRIIFVKG